MALGVAKRPLGELLKESNLITDEQLGQALQYQKENGGVLGKILVDLGMVKEEDIRLVLGSQFGMPVVNLDELEIPPTVVEKVSPSVADAYRIIPVEYADGILTVAMADPLNISALDDLKFLLSCDIKGAVSDEETVKRAYDKYYANISESVESIVQELIDQKVGTEIVEDTTETIDLHAGRIGELAFVTVPCEIFCHFGLQVKRRSPFPITAVFGVTNGEVGYCPTIEGAMGGSWEGTVSLTSRWDVKTGYRIVDEWSRMLYELEAKC